MFYSFYINGAEWANKRVNQHLYSNSQILNAGAIYDRNGTVLAYSEDGARLYNESETVRKAVLHAVGDNSSYIATGAQSVYRTYLSGYDFVNGVYNKPATCENPGVDHVYCKRCNYWKQDAIAALGHKYELTNTEEATCTNPAVEIYTCSTCYGTKREDVGSPKGHSFGEPITRGDGSVVKICSDCNFDELIKEAPTPDEPEKSPSATKIVIIAAAAGVGAGVGGFGIYWFLKKKR